MSILYLYLGKKGGGQEFNRIMLDFYSRNLEENITFLNTELNINSHNLVGSKSNLLKIHRPNNISNLIKYLKDVVNFYSNLSTGQINIDKVVILMMSPWDYPFMRICKLYKREIILIVHDVYPHPGEFWPFKRSIAKRIRLSSKLVFLSDTVYNKYCDSFSKSKIKNNLVIPHPIFELGKKIIDENGLSNEKGYILFVGRISKYKGIDTLIDAVQSSTNEFKLLIAGSGKIKQVKNRRIVYINKWLSNEEILHLISNARVVVFPYIEASQSGLLPITMSLEKDIVVSDQPGLIEQSKNYGYLKVFKSGNSAELRQVLEQVYSSDKDGTPFANMDMKSKLTEHYFASNLHHFIVN
jgi:glycosyltransferase involved in cell wall biosynthesis